MRKLLLVLLFLSSVTEGQSLLISANVPANNIQEIVSSPSFFSTSASGAVDDADISLGSNSFGTDSYAALQALLDRALTGPIVIFWDGHYSVSQSLKIRGNTKIITVPGCGFILRDDAPYGTAIMNEWVPSSSVGGWGSNIVDENISIEGLIVNGNGPGQSHIAHAVWFIGVRNLSLADVTVFAAGSFALHIANVEHFNVNDLKIDHGVYVTTNHDGLHIDGYARWVNVENVNATRCDDDVVVLMNSEGGPYTTGPIYDCVIRNVTMHNCVKGLRIAPAPGYAMERILIDGVFGATKNGGIRFHTFSGTNATASDIELRNINLVMEDANPLIHFISGHYKNVSIDGIKVTQTFDYKLVLWQSAGESYGLRISNVLVQGVSTLTNPLINIEAGTVNGLIVSDVHFQAATERAMSIVKVSTGTVHRLQMSNIQSVNSRNIVEAASGTLNLLQMSNIYHYSANATIKTEITIPQAEVSGWSGTLIKSGAGSITKQLGSAFDYLGVFTVSTVPTAALYTGAEILVSDEVGGVTRAFSDGTNWRRNSDRAIITN